MQAGDIITFLVRLTFGILPPFVGIVLLPLLVSRSKTFKKERRKAIKIFIVLACMFGGSMIGFIFSFLATSAIYGIETATGNCLGLTCIIGR